MQRSISQDKAPDAASWVNKADDFARRQPTKAVASAAGVGFLINFLPIGTLVGGLFAVGFALIRPALLCLGLLRAFEFLRTQSPTQTNYERI